MKMLLSFSVVLVSLCLTTEGVEVAFVTPDPPKSCCDVCPVDDALSSIPVPKGYTRSGVYNNLFYKLYKEEVTWIEAHLQCIEDGGLLAHPRNDAEARDLLAFVKKSIKGEKRKNKYRYIHSGFIKWNGWFTALSGELVADSGFHTWDKGEPNNKSFLYNLPTKATLDELCGTFSEYGTLNDIHCQWSYKNFLCEIRVDMIF